MEAPQHVAIIGGGQAAATAASALRRAGYSNAITLIAEEATLPYERPPLSKGILTGDEPQDKALMHSLEFYREHTIDVRLGVRAEALDPVTRRIELSQGPALNYDALVLATGAEAMRLPVPGAGLEGVFYLRTLEESLVLAGQLQQGRRLVVVGGGYIGLEVASAARKRGVDVTVVEMQTQILARAVAPEIATIIQGYHETAGVRFHLGKQVAALEGERRVNAVRCGDGGAITADIVVIGIGSRPCDNLAVTAGLDVDDGVMVDETGKTSDPAIFAAGDVTRHFNPLMGRHLRLESWQNAQNQAIVVAQNLAGKPTRYAEVPWFWSDQLGFNLQMVGMAECWNEIVIRGNPEELKFTALYLCDGVLVAANTVNQARDIRPARELIARGTRLGRSILADPGRPLRALLDA